MRKSELDKILAEHRKWISEDGGKRANLRGANLGGANLREANLYEANLRGANLGEANLREANLYEANLRGANLGGANLREANLCGANLRGANLCEANLCKANLREVNLREANLRGAYLGEANLRGAYLGGANLYGANLRGAYLPAPQVVLLANWGALSDSRTLQLMRYDADNHPNKKLFDTWANGGPCPYNDINVQRSVIFHERMDLWRPFRKPPSAYKLMMAVLKECGCLEAKDEDKE
jgi:hypothetical protein